MYEMRRLYRYKVYDVGDANCISIVKLYSNLYSSPDDCKCAQNVCIEVECPIVHKVPIAKYSPCYFFCPSKDKIFFVDYGCQNLEKHFAHINNFEIRYATDFLLSHYHQDHYNGLFNIEDDSLRIKNLYYPYIPQINDKVYGKKYLSNILCFCDCLKHKSLSGMGLAVKELFEHKNIGNKIHNLFAVSEGDIIFDGFKVVWPPKMLDVNQDIALRNNIFKIEYEINKSSNTRIKDLWNLFNRMERPIYNLTCDSKSEEFVDSYLCKYNISPSEYNETVKRISKILSKITNRFSVCLYREGDFLFLGDLEKIEVKLCLEQIVRDNNGEKIKVKNLITPHHGSKRHYLKTIGDYISSDYVISSNGSEMYKEYKKEYCEISKYAHCTYIDHDYEDKDDVVKILYSI